MPHLKKMLRWLCDRHTRVFFWVFCMKSIQRINQLCFLFAMRICSVLLHSFDAQKSTNRTNDRQKNWKSRRNNLNESSTRDTLICVFLLSNKFKSITGEWLTKSLGCKNKCSPFMHNSKKKITIRWSHDLKPVQIQMLFGPHPYALKTFNPQTITYIHLMIRRFN